MNMTHTTITTKKILNAGFVLLLAICLAVPAHARDEELEPDAFTGETTTAVSSTADVATAEPVLAASSDSIDHFAHRSAPADSGGLTLAGLFDWLWSLLRFGG